MAVDSGVVAVVGVPAVVEVAVVVELLPVEVVVAAAGTVFLHFLHTKSSSGFTWLLIRPTQSMWNHSLHPPSHWTQSTSRPVPHRAGVSTGIERKMGRNSLPDGRMQFSALHSSSSSDVEAAVVTFRLSAFFGASWFGWFGSLRFRRFFLLFV